MPKSGFRSFYQYAAAVVSLLFVSVMLFGLSGGPTIPRTGAPGESNCTGCHHSASDNVRGTMSVSFSGGNVYTEGVWKRVTITITPNPAVNADVKYGFQATARRASGAKIGTLGIVNNGNTGYQAIKCAATATSTLTDSPPSGCGSQLEFVQHAQPYTGGAALSYKVSFLWKPSTVTCITFPCSQDFGTLTFYATSVVGISPYATPTDPFRTTANLTYQAPITSADPVYPAGSLGLEAFDTPTNQIVSTRYISTVTLYKTAMKHDGSRLYALTNNGDQLLALNPNGGLLGTLALSTLSGFGYDIALSPDESTLYLVGPSTDQTTTHLDVIDVGGQSVFGASPMVIDLNSTSYSRLAVSPDGKRIYVIRPYNAGPVLVINTTNFSQLAPIALASPGMGVAVTPDNSRLYVAAQDNTLSIFSTATEAILYHYALTPNPSTIVFSPDGLRAYVLSQGISDVITTIDTVSSMPLGAFTVSNFPGFGRVFRISTDGAYLFGGGSPSLYDGGSLPAWSLHLTSGLPTGTAVEIPSAQGVLDVGVRPPALLALKTKGGQVTSQ